MWWEERLKKYQKGGFEGIDLGSLNTIQPAAVETTGTTMPIPFTAEDYKPEPHKPTYYPQPKQAQINQDNRTPRERELTERRSAKMIQDEKVYESVGTNPNLGFIRGQIGGGRGGITESKKAAANIYMNTVANSTPPAMLGKTAINAAAALKTGDPVEMYYRDTKGLPDGMRRPMAYADFIMNALGTAAYAKIPMPQIKQSIKPITAPLAATAAPFMNKLNLPKISLTPRQASIKSTIGNVVSNTRSKLDPIHNITDKVYKGLDQDKQRRLKTEARSNMIGGNTEQLGIANRLRREI